MDISSPDSVKSMEVSLESFPEGTIHGIRIRKDDHAFLFGFNPPFFHLTQPQWLSPLAPHYVAHCKEDPIYVFPGMKLRGLAPSFHIHVSVSD